MGLLPELVEIDIPGCYRGTVQRFNDWRVAVADMTGVSVRYQWVARTVSLKSPGPGPAPTQLPFVVAEMEPGRAELTPRQRLGHWDLRPDDPLLILLAMTVPGGTIRAADATPMAERLRPMRELMHAIDDGRYGLTAIGPFTQAMEAGLAAIGRNGVDVLVSGGYEPTGWWDVVPIEMSHRPIRHQKGIMDVPEEGGIVDGTLTEVGEDLVRVDSIPFMSDRVKFGDVVRVRRLGRPGEFEYVETVVPTTWRCVTLALSREVVEGPALQRIGTRLHALGCVWDRVFGGLLLVAIPPEAQAGTEDLVGRLFDPLQ